MLDKHWSMCTLAGCRLRQGCAVQVAALSHLVSMVKGLPPLMEGGGGRTRRGGMGALPSAAVPLGEPVCGFAQRTCLRSRSDSIAAC